MLLFIDKYSLCGTFKEVDVHIFLDTSHLQVFYWCKLLYGTLAFIPHTIIEEII